ncbi:hypothetical protein [Methanosarcina horonobensis]|nr:hypothetical protein [Methanosarcina horonobensis]
MIESNERQPDRPTTDPGKNVKINCQAVRVLSELMSGFQPFKFTITV